MEQPHESPVQQCYAQEQLSSLQTKILRLAQALVLLNRAELRPKGVYIAESDGSYRQVGP